MASTPPLPSSRRFSREIGTSLHMIRLAILGAGRIGQLHASNIASNVRAQLNYVYDPDADSAARMATQAGAKVATVSEILSAPDVDGVLITSPTTTHIELLTAAMKA